MNERHYQNRDIFFNRCYNACSANNIYINKPFFQTTNGAHFFFIFFTTSTKNLKSFFGSSKYLLTDALPKRGIPGTLSDLSPVKHFAVNHCSTSLKPVCSLKLPSSKNFFRIGSYKVHSWLYKTGRKRTTRDFLE